MALELSGKRVIITAAGGGIGRQTVKLFSEAGAKIYICDIDEEGLNATIAGHDNVGGMVADVSDPAAFDTLFERADAYLGGLDFMVNNAGTAGPTAPIEEVTLEDWQNLPKRQPNQRIFGHPARHSADQGSRRRRHRQPLLGGW